MSYTFAILRYRFCRCFNTDNYKVRTVPQCMLTECAICFKLKHISKTNYYRCNHNIFCTDCIKEWRTRANNCPLCRAEAHVGYKYRIAN